MQGNDPNLGKVYDDREKYFDTMQRLMVGMTFSDGHAAVSPSCWESAGGKRCDNTLWPISNSSNTRGNLQCRTRGCRETPVLACSRMNHHCLCTRCAEKEKTKILGVSGPSASTHIYDGRIRKVSLSCS